jgi:hypothetical protein
LFKPTVAACHSGATFGGPADDPVATILDWQTVTRSLAAIDVVFLIGGSEPVAERRGRVEELVAAGVNGSGPREARRDLQLAALELQAQEALDALPG